MGASYFANFPYRIQFTGDFPRRRCGVSVDAPAFLNVSTGPDVGKGISIQQISLGASRVSRTFSLLSVTLGSAQLSLDIAPVGGMLDSVAASSGGKNHIAVPRVIEVRGAVAVPQSLTAIEVHGLSPDYDGQIWFAFEDASGYVENWCSIIYAGSQINVPPR